MTITTTSSSARLSAVVLALSGFAFTPVSVALADTYTDGNAQQRPLELTDIMQFREIERRVVSENGQWIAFSAVPDLGDSTGYVISTADATQYEVERGERPAISADGRYVVFRQRASLLQREQAQTRDEKRALRTHAVIVDTRDGSQTVYEDVDRYLFSGDGQALALLHKSADDEHGRTVRFVRFGSGEERQFSGITDIAAAKKGGRFGLIRERKNDDDEVFARIRIYNSESNQYLDLTERSEKITGLSFNHAGNALAFLQGPRDSDNPDPAQSLWLWNYGQRSAQQLETQRDGWVLSEHATPRWSEDDRHVRIGHRPQVETPASAPGAPQTESDLYNLDRLLSDRRLQVWHGDDERIITHQRESQRNLRQATAPAVVWVSDNRLVVLGDDTEDSIQRAGTNEAGLISNSREHLREISWNGFYHDIDYVNYSTGERQPVVQRVRSNQRGSLSPDSQFVAYNDDGRYYVFDAQSGQSQQVAADVEVSWVDEQNDRPMEASSYGVAGWLDDSSAFLAYDRYDIWKISVEGEAVKLTDGRDNTMQYRVEVLNDDAVFSADETLFIHGYHDREKYHGFYSLHLGSSQHGNAELNTLIEGPKRYQRIDYLAEQDQILYTEEDFRQFPDIWVASRDFSQRQQLTNINPQIEQFVWGDPELIEWQTDDGDTLQGIVIKPDNYDANRRYPVMVYYYELYSQRMYHFNQMKVNHRPNFPFYVGQEYVVFLPDIRFRPGAPGPSATESLVPGVQKLIDTGVADPEAIGLHGHSWSGYQSAFVVTETDMFAAVVSGAPVSNMTSAYTGIRWQTGLARQFQYETGQSRIGPSMYEDLDPYIKNSPVFFADRINTPMLIQFGDADGAVPWEQGIEYYLALRRLDKEVVMLHYEDEPHHLQRYANKIDYSIKMLEFFDHYLKGADAPDWWVDGMPYQVYED